MADLDEYAMAKLAREMAMNIRNYKDVYADFGLSEETYYEVSKHPFFIKAKEQFIIEWNSALSTTDRVKITSAAGAEQGLLPMTRRMLDPNEPLASAATVFKQLCQNAGIGDPKSAGSNTERFVITINIGDDSKTYDKSLVPDTKDLDLSAVREAITEKHNGQADDATSQELTLQVVRPAGEGQRP